MNKLNRTAALGMSIAMLACAALPAWGETALSPLLPQSIRDAGTLRIVAWSSSSPPMIFAGDDARTLVGLEVELTQAIADVLGVKAEFTNGTFDSLIPSIAADRADLAVGSIGDLKSRQSQVDFIDYAKAGIGMAVLAGNPDKISDLASLCGKKVAVVRGTFQEKELSEQQDKCKTAGTELDVQTFGDSNAAVLALRSARVHAWSGDSAPVGYVVSQSDGALELSGPMRAIALLGFAVNKDNPQLRDALKGALDELVKNGTYKALFEKWGQAETMVDKITVNDAWL